MANTRQQNRIKKKKKKGRGFMQMRKVLMCLRQDVCS